MIRLRQVKVSLDNRDKLLAFKMELSQQKLEQMTKKANELVAKGQKAILLIFVIFGVMFFKDLYVHNGDITHRAVDSAVHYRAAKHYSDNLKIFINVEDKTFFNFNVMQTGAYINDGIFMNVINGITGIEHCYLYQAFETIILFVL